MYIYLQNFHSPIRSPHTTTPRQRSARFSRATILRSTRGANHSLSHTPRLITTPRRLVLDIAPTGTMSTSLCGARWGYTTFCNKYNPFDLHRMKTEKNLNTNTFIEQRLHLGICQFSCDVNQMDYICYTMS